MDSISHVRILRKDFEPFLIFVINCRTVSVILPELSNFLKVFFAYIRAA